MPTPEEMLKTLAADFFSQSEITASTSSLNRATPLALDRETIISLIGKMSDCQQLENIFKQNEPEDRSGSFSSQKYYNKWDFEFCRTLEELSGSEKKSLFQNKGKILANVLSNKITEWLSQENKNGRKQFALEHSISKHEELGIKKKNSNTRNVAIASIKILAGIFVLLTVCAAILMGVTNKPEVSIEINLGEILAGLFGGIGAATAGLAYAYSKLNPQKEAKNERYNG